MPRVLVPPERSSLLLLGRPRRRGAARAWGAFEVANSTVISRSVDRAPTPYSAHQTRGQVSHSGQRVRVQVPPPAPYSLHSQVAPCSARQVRAQAGQPALLVSELRANEAAPRARYRARRMLPQVRPAAAAAAEALTAGGGEERYQPRGATNSQRIAQYRAWVAMLRAAPGVVLAHEPRISASTLRVRRHRIRRREGLRLLTLEMPQPAIETANHAGLPQARGDQPSMVSDPKRVCRPAFRPGAELAHRQCGDHSGTAHQRGCDPPLHQRLAGAGGSTIKRQ